MPWWEAVLLGLVQGLTEFLPISSSGHLVVAHQLFGWNTDVLSFDLILHLGTLVAILVFFGKSLLKVTRREWWWVILGTIPAGLIGVIFKDRIEQLFASDAWVGWELMATGVLNLVVDRRLGRMPAKPGASIATELSWQKSILMGIGQAIAIIPGISRSGSTVAVGILTGVEREAAFRFSFLLAIPALAGAAVLQLKDMTATDFAVLSWPAIGLGFVTAMLSGLASLVIFHWVIKRARLEWFGWYCILLGAGVVWWFR